MVPVLNRHQQRKAATHQRLLEAAREIIVEKGYNNADILDITERADVSKATFYKHFSNKEACVRQVMHQGFDALVEHIMAGKQTASSHHEWIINSFQILFEWADENREMLLIMVGGAASSQLNVFGRNYMVEIIEQSMPQFSIPDGAPVPIPRAVIAQIVTGVVIQLLGWWLENDTSYTPTDMGQLVHDVLLHGIGPVVEN